MSERAQGKRPLCQVLEAGMAREDLMRAAKSPIVYNVVDSSGDFFGLCVRAPSGNHVYVDPEPLVGVAVAHPFRVNGTVNTQHLTQVLGDGLCAELCR